MKSTFILLAVLIPSLTYTQNLNPCNSQTTCHECIQRSNCAWCLDPNYRDFNRCFEASYSNIDKCREEYMWNPENNLEILENKELSNKSSSSPSSSAFQKIQLAPQRVNMKLRKNEANKIHMSYTYIEDFPIDVYYLIDLSKSMENNTNKVLNLANLLTESLGNITSNFRIGFGSFVDVTTSDTSCENCETSYKNHMSLSSNTTLFLNMVKNMTISDNYDTPESSSGSNALLQAIECREHIGWRINSRKVLILVTNSGFRYSEDTIIPNDGCHLNSRSVFQNSPSLSQLNKKIIENRVNIIFAVTQNQISYFNKLHNYVTGSTVAKLFVNSANVVELVKNYYSQISANIEFKDTALSPIKVNYYSSCFNLNNKPKRTNVCSNIKVGDVVQFEVEIEVTSCPKDPKDWKQTLQIYPVGIPDSLTVHLELMCSCPCESSDHVSYKPNAEECFGNGVLKCGVCECESDYFGKHCECSTHQQFGSSTCKIGST